MRLVGLIGLTVAIAACASPRAIPSGGPASQPARVADPASLGLVRATEWLLSEQSADGAWRSKRYHALADGRALTPVVLSTLLFAAKTATSARAYDRGVDFVASLVAPDGRVDEGEYGLEYPVYTLSASLLVLSVPRNRRYSSRIPPLIAALRARQLGVENGWSPSDPQHGGWGYFRGIPRRPAPGAVIDELLTSNTGSTLFATGALLLAGVDLDDPSMAAARMFVERCQNFSDPPRSSADDGGLFFTPTDEIPNKAGAFDDPATGRRQRSYGTATADGLRALLRLGVPRDHPRVRAAADWLLTHWTPDRVPGDYPPDQEIYRDSALGYWAWTSAHALLLLGPEAEAHPNTRDWPERLAAALLARQRPDGSFVNAAADLREDDPIVATALSAAALAIARLARADGLETAVEMEPAR
ncbi:terpene cyclase/mutase family protein [Myxococcota bacterium]|nr:terpene cyclase/mutase family protein [Myxococcota bacterium]